MSYSITHCLRRSALVAALAAVRTATAQAPVQPADVRFMQGMISHHAQAIVMAGLVASRTQREDMRLLAERIDVSQRDEIATMSQWLATHRQPAATPDTHAMAGHDMPGMPGMSGMARDSMPTMPGMATPAQMDSLRAARGTAFDRLFLTYMIRHHEGALKMVADLFASRGAGQDSDVFRLASDVDVDQRAEIARMRQLLAALPAR
jgi:uncharacterized protein (DUF305 family)